MCRKIACVNCSKLTWMGCGLHIDACLVGVEEVERCPGWKGLGWRTENCSELEQSVKVALPIIETTFLRRRMAPDGSCLFTAILYLMRSDTVDASSCTYFDRSIMICDLY